ncbi:MAG TPA: metal-dependent hydrolase [Burkholderiales bacterium]
MDTLTHALSGALLARATEPSGTPTIPRRTRMAVMFWAAAFPDSDFVLRFIDPLTYLTTHRGVTHSVLMLPFWAIGLALLFQFLYRGRRSWRDFVGICALGIGIHIAGDVITSFGTMVLAPVSTWRAQFPLTFIIDPYFTAIIVAGLSAALHWRDSRAPAVIGLAVLTAYVGVQAGLHYRAKGIGEAYISANGLDRAQAHALPQPFSPFHWLIVVVEPQRYTLSYISLTRTDVRTPPVDAGVLRRVYDSYRPLDRAIWQIVPRYGESVNDREIVRALWDSKVFTRYRRFAMFPAAYRVDRASERTCVRFADLRFALSGRTAPFRYAGCRENSAGDWRMYYVSDDGTELLYAIE